MENRGGVFGGTVGPEQIDRGLNQETATVIPEATVVTHDREASESTPTFPTTQDTGHIASKPPAPVEAEVQPLKPLVNSFEDPDISILDLQEAIGNNTEGNAG